MKNPARFLSITCFGLLSIAALPAANAEFKCDGRPLTRVDATACAKAVESPDSLRRYVTRTRMIYGLQTSNYARFEDAPQTRPAQASQVDTQNSTARVAPPAR